MWIFILTTSSVCVGVHGIGTTEDPCEISAGAVFDFVQEEDNPSNESLMGLLPGFSFCDDQSTEVGLLEQECKLKDTPNGCEMLTNFVLRECVSYRSGNWVKSCSVMVEGLIAGNSHKDELFPRVFTKVLEEIIDDADDPLFKVFDEECERRKKEDVPPKKVIALCSTVGAWISAINATDQAISTPENLRTYIASVDELYANMTRWHLRKKWHPTGTTLSTTYEQECSSQNKVADMYCEVLKEKLDAYQKECARDPIKCETQTSTESNRATTLRATFFLTLLVVIRTVNNKL